MDGNEEMSGTFLPCGGSEVTPLPHIPGLTDSKGARWLELGEEDSGSSSDLFFIIFDRLSSKLSAKGDLHPSGMEELEAWVTRLQNSVSELEPGPHEY